MTTFYVIDLLSDPNGYHLIHKYGCLHFPNNFYEIGLFDTYAQAALTSKLMLPNTSCCPHCISMCKETNDTVHLDYPSPKVLDLKTK
ncbi:hypothetical protein [Anditalea andensis]|uniref:hypothetical protein n=1 Tax=Anditalea andensis TaxID=1048983 RepID=UPI0013E0268A|nr:hypothetical protein [Anditalea andensis]